MMRVGMIMSDEHYRFPLLALLRQQTWLSPAFPTGSYSYSHGIEWAVASGGTDSGMSFAFNDIRQHVDLANPDSSKYTRLWCDISHGGSLDF
jgi:hypothetical protein